jgi:hypothetical protein
MRLFDYKTWLEPVRQVVATRGRPVVGALATALSLSVLLPSLPAEAHPVYTAPRG